MNRCRMTRGIFWDNMQVCNRFRHRVIDEKLGEKSSIKFWKRPLIRPFSLCDLMLFNCRVYRNIVLIKMLPTIMYLCNYVFIYGTISFLNGRMHKVDIAIFIRVFPAGLIRIRMSSSQNQVGSIGCIELDQLWALMNWAIGFDWQWTDDVANDTFNHDLSIEKNYFI